MKTDFHSFLQALAVAANLIRLLIRYRWQIKVLWHIFYF